MSALGDRNEGAEMSGYLCRECNLSFAHLYQLESHEIAKHRGSLTIDHDQLDRFKLILQLAKSEQYYGGDAVDLDLIDFWLEMMERE